MLPPLRILNFICNLLNFKITSILILFFLNISYISLTLLLLLLLLAVRFYSEYLQTILQLSWRFTGFPGYVCTYFPIIQVAIFVGFDSI